MIEKRINGGDYQPTLTDKIVLDSVPTVNSLNGVTSDAVARAVAGASGEVPAVTENDNGKVLKAIYDEGGPAVEWAEGGSDYSAGTGVAISDQGAISVKIDGSTITTNGEGQLVAAGGGSGDSFSVIGTGAPNYFYKNDTFYVTRGWFQTGGAWRFNSKGTREEDSAFIYMQYEPQAVQFYRNVMVRNVAAGNWVAGDYNVHLVCGANSSAYAVYNEPVGVVTTNQFGYASSVEGFKEVTPYSVDNTKWTVTGTAPAWTNAKYWLTIAGTTGGDAPNGELNLWSCVDSSYAECGFLVLAYNGTPDFSKFYLNSNMPMHDYYDAGKVLAVKSDGSLEWKSLT